MAIDWEFYSGDQRDYEAFVPSHKNQEVINTDIGLRNPTFQFFRAFFLFFVF